jgi:hypothetical protein
MGKAIQMQELPRRILSLSFASVRIHAERFCDIGNAKFLYHDSRFQRLTLLRSYRDRLRRSSSMQACRLACAHYIMKNPRSTFEG